ncbi:hypothetical protein Tco_0014990 [Tanacetum coccineum]
MNISSSSISAMDFSMEVKDRHSPEKIEEEENEKKFLKNLELKERNPLPRKSSSSTVVKRQKMELDDEKEDLKVYLDIVPREYVAEDVESLSTKYLIVDWKTYVLTENYMYYQIFRGDGSSKNYKVLSEMLEDFDRQDVMEKKNLHQLGSPKERYSASRPEGNDLMLWGDLHTLFEPDEEDEIWKNQHEYNVISWSLCDFCGIHILLMQNGIAIHMLTEKKYPLSQEMLSKMLSKRLEVDHESTQAYELLKFIRSQGRIVGNKSSSRVNTAKMDSKFSNHSTMDWYTKNALWIYWIRGDDEEVLIDKDLYDLEETYVFNEFSYLLKIDTGLLTHDIPRFKTYEEYKNSWIHEWNEDVPWIPKEPWSKNGVPYEIVDHHCIMNGKTNEEAVKDEREPMNDYGIGDSNDHLVLNNAPDYANEEEEQYKEGRCNTP